MINNYILKSIIYGGIDGIITMFNILRNYWRKIKNKIYFHSWQTPLTLFVLQY